MVCKSNIWATMCCNFMQLHSQPLFISEQLGKMQKCSNSQLTVKMAFGEPVGERLWQGY